MIPKKIHFIWVGGKIPKEYLDEIKKLTEVASRSGYEVNLWVDNEKNYSKVVDKEYDGHAVKDLKIRNINELIPRIKSDAFYAERVFPDPSGAQRLEDEQRAKRGELPKVHKGITLGEYFIENVNREMVGFKNLAGAADLLRDEILRQEAGIYVDCDQKYKLKKTDILPELNLPLNFAANIRTFEATKNHNGHVEVKQFIGINNDLIACTENHPAICNKIKVSMKKYGEYDKYDLVKAKREKELKTKMDDKRFPFFKGDPQTFEGVRSKRAQGTMDLSGPGALQEGLIEFLNSSQLTRFAQVDSILKNSFSGFKIETHSHQNWLQKKSIKQQRSFDTSDIMRTFAQQDNNASNVPHKKKLTNFDIKQMQDSFETFDNFINAKESGSVIYNAKFNDILMLVNEKRILNKANMKALENFALIMDTGAKNPEKEIKNLTDVVTKMHKQQVLTEETFYRVMVNSHYLPVISAAMDQFESIGLSIESENTKKASKIHSLANTEILNSLLSYMIQIRSMDNIIERNQKVDLFIKELIAHASYLTNALRSNSVLGQEQIAVRKLVHVLQGKTVNLTEADLRVFENMPLDNIFNFIKTAMPHKFRDLKNADISVPDSHASKPRV